MAQTPDNTPQDSASKVFKLVLPGEHFLGDWGGVRSKLEDSGIIPRWFLITDVAGNPGGGRDQGATQTSNVIPVLVAVGALSVCVVVAAPIALPFGRSDLGNTLAPESLFTLSRLDEESC